ncbi:hypothetical protein RZA67_15510 [Stenotrophomonas sp. C3(2023)]|uniref:hypothetical protein n=1 Tax=Stenotrophomonas sp. C3(2023) TaxID=3080277 RepID=UPI00293C57C9|nr:hypothetical protein [Stenotrophomonas sp. C3(2023)]MDV3470130.1 hypothetical protein [Stenotrophomonas sp. C3(2023)]
MQLREHLHQCMQVLAGQAIQTVPAADQVHGRNERGSPSRVRRRRSFCQHREEHGQLCTLDVGQTIIGLQQIGQGMQGNAKTVELIEIMAEGVE